METKLQQHVVTEELNFVFLHLCQVFVRLPPHLRQGLLGVVPRLLLAVLASAAEGRPDHSVQVIQREAEAVRQEGSSLLPLRFYTGLVLEHGLLAGLVFSGLARFRHLCGRLAR